MIETYLADRFQTTTPYLDEMAMPDGQVSPQWSKLAAAYQKMDVEKMEQYHREVEQQLRENGVTYNIYGDPEGKNRRPWVLDPVPMVFGSEDWAVIEQGLQQRAQLLNLILSDIYGSRQLIKDGHIPFELIYNHKGFLRQADKITMDGPQQLIHYSADLARGPDGRMWVLHDRTDAPSGAGYTMENRAAMTRVFPELIRENQVRKIASYYQTLKNTLTNLASRNKDNPRIVLLSPGPTNETYFEHAYLSSFMGFTLAFGDDLTVSDGYVWLKTIKGLEKVDVIIRRVDDLFCDPLEFRSDSHLGVVGLMEAVRQKNVIVVNPLGCRILENPGLMAFLPKLCQHILGEELILPSVATWWCGHEEALVYVLENIRNLIIRKIYRDNINKSVFGGSLSQTELENLKAEIRQYPYLFVGQEMVNFSTTPSLINEKLEARNAVFRSYIVADTQNNDYHVMPGGLSRSSPNQGVFIVSNQSGGISKDTWVLGKPEHHERKISTPIHLQKVETVLPSRTGEHLFWLGRYIERSVVTVRLLRIVLKTYNETEGDVRIKEDKVLSTLFKSLTLLTSTYPGFTDEKLLRNPDEELVSLVLDQNRPGTLAFSIQAFLSNAYAVRDRLSLDTWRILDTISDESARMNQHRGRLTQLYHGLDNMIIRLMAFYGLNIDNMTREPTWHLLNIGRFLESSINNCTVLRSMLTKRFDPESNRTLMEGVLRSNESLVTYRYRYRSTLELEGVLSLLMQDESNPRSAVYQIAKAEEHLESLPIVSPYGTLSPARKKLIEAHTKIRLADIRKLAEGNKNNYAALNSFLGEVIVIMKDASNLIYEGYFAHTGSKYSMVQNERLPEI